MPEPITVNASSLPAMLAAGLRQLLTVLGTAAVAAGWVKPEHIEGIITIVVTLVAVAWGQWKTRARHQDAATLAQYVPDSVAKVR